MHCQSFVESMVNARTLGVPLSIVDRERTDIFGQEVACIATLEQRHEETNIQIVCFYYPGQKIRFSQDIHEIDPRSAIVCYHARSTLKLDIARYHMIGLWINLMNFSAVTIFLARVVAL